MAAFVLRPHVAEFIDVVMHEESLEFRLEEVVICLLYTSDAADERSSVDLGGRRIIKKKKTITVYGASLRSTRT